MLLGVTLGEGIMQEPGERKAGGDSPAAPSTTSTIVGSMPVGASVVSTAGGHPGLRLTDEVLVGLCAVSEAVEAGLEASVGAFLMLADACSRSGDLPARDGALARAVSWISASADSPENDIRDLWLACLWVGRAAEAVRRPVLARDAYTTAIERANAATDPDIVANLWQEIGDTWRTEGVAEQARLAYRAAAALYGSSALAQDVLAKLAEVERRWGTPEEAERVFAEALAMLDRRQRARMLDPQKVALEALRLGEAAMSLGLSPLARESYVLGRDQLPPSADPNLLGALWHGIGAALSASGDGVHALEAYRAAVACPVVAMKRVVFLRSLAGAELDWGTKDAAANAVSDALGILIEGSGSAAVNSMAVVENARLLVPVVDALDDPDLAYRARLLAKEVGQATDPGTAA
jgi:tetratricopeptide (TPR) repeat protein